MRKHRIINNIFKINSVSGKQLKTMCTGWYLKENFSVSSLGEVKKYPSRAKDHTVSLYVNTG